MSDYDLDSGGAPDRSPGGERGPRGRGRGGRARGGKQRQPVEQANVQPAIVSLPDVPAVDPVGFKPFGLNSLLLDNCGRMGYAEPTEIQRECIGPAMTGKDIVGLAQTGTGKTAAFLLPVLHRLLLAGPSDSRSPRVLVLAPTRELAMQTERYFVNLASGTALRCTTVLGGMNMNRQIQALRDGLDAVIATPGRLLDLHEQGACDLSRVEILVFDECDRMLDMGFMPDVKRILRLLPRERQTLMFSATMPYMIEQMCHEQMHDPVTVRTHEGRTIPEGIRHCIYRLPQAKKTELLMDLMLDPAMTSVIVFTRTKDRADRLQHTLEQLGVSATKIHGDRTQRERLQALQEFREKKYRALIATDLASRGLDIRDISHVINYDVPQTPEDYVHRAGRTGRQNATGDAFTFASMEEEVDVRAIEKFLGKPIPSLVHPVHHYPGDLARQKAEAEAPPPRKAVGRGVVPWARRRR